MIFSSSLSYQLVNADLLVCMPALDGRIQNETDGFAKTHRAYIPVLDYLTLCGTKQHITARAAMHPGATASKKVVGVHLTLPRGSTPRFFRTL